MPCLFTSNTHYRSRDARSAISLFNASIHICDVFSKTLKVQTTCKRKEHSIMGVDYNTMFKCKAYYNNFSNTINCCPNHVAKGWFVIKARL